MSRRWHNDRIFSHWYKSLVEVEKKIWLYMYFTFGYDWISSYDMVKKKGGAEKRTQLLTTWMSFCLLIHDYWVGVNANLTIQHLCVFIFYILTTRLILQTRNKRRNCTWLHFTFTHSLQKDKRKNYAVILQALSEPFIVCNIRLCTIHYPTIESRELKKNVFLLWKKQCLVDDIFKSLRLWIFYVKDIWFVHKTPRQC